MSTTLIFVCAVLAIGFALLVFWMRGREIPPLSGARAKIEQSLLAKTVHSQTPSLCFDPKSAVLVHEVEEIQGGNLPTIQVQRIYRNSAREYFLFVGTSGEPGYLTHLSKERAMNALRSEPALFQREFQNPSS